MTYNEFKMCCILFCKTFEGRKYGEVVENCYSSDFDLIIPNTLIFDDRYFKIKNILIFSFGVNNYLVLYKEIVIDSNFESIEDFLKYFNIPLVDVV